MFIMLPIENEMMDVADNWIAQLWSSAESREFLQREYSWFLPIYDSYRHPVQRVDALKYFIMRHYGGIYVDMDNVSRAIQSLSFLRKLAI
jgi:mannosyltransferase OCH1-like enzyme